MSAIKKKKLGERVGGGLMALKGVDDQSQVFSIVSDDILSYVYHYDDLYNSLGKFMCISEMDDNGKVTKKAACCKLFKKRQDRVILPVIHYEGSKKSFRKIEEGKFKYLSITSFKYNDLCKQLDEEGVDLSDLENSAVDIILKAEDASKGKISFSIIDSEEPALWTTNKAMKKQIAEALETWEEDIIASLPNEYTEEELERLIEEAKEEQEAPEGVEEPEDNKKASKSDIPKKKSKAKVEKDLDDDLDDTDEEEDETPKKKKKSVKEQIEETDYDSSEDSDDLLDEEDLDEDDSSLEGEDDFEEDETPRKKKKRVISDEDDED